MDIAAAAAAAFDEDHNDSNNQHVCAADRASRCLCPSQVPQHPPASCSTYDRTPAHSCHSRHAKCLRSLWQRRTIAVIAFHDVVICEVMCLFVILLQIIAFCAERKFGSIIRWLGTPLPPLPPCILHITIIDQGTHRLHAPFSRHLLSRNPGQIDTSLRMTCMLRSSLNCLLMLFMVV